MQSPAQTTSVSKQSLWAGRMISALTIAFLLFDSGLKVMNLAPAVEATARLGYPPGLVRSLGIVEIVCLAVFLIPRTATLGAILLTGYLGGATATQVRLEDPWFFFPVLVGVLVWSGLYLRDPALRALLPLRTTRSLHP